MKGGKEIGLFVDYMEADEYAQKHGGKVSKTKSYKQNEAKFTKNYAVKNFDKWDFNKLREEAEDAGSVNPDLATYTFTDVNGMWDIKTNDEFENLIGQWNSKGNTMLVCSSTLDNWMFENDYLEERFSKVETPDESAKNIGEKKTKKIDSDNWLN